MSKSSGSNDGTPGTRSSAPAQPPPIAAEPAAEGEAPASPTLDLADTDIDVSTASKVVPSSGAGVSAVLKPARSRKTPAAGSSRAGASFTRKKVLLILCSRNGTVRQAIGRFGNQMNLALEIIDYYPEEPHRIVEDLFENRDAQFAIVYWSEPEGREPPGFAHPERYLGFVLGFAIGRLGRGRVFVLASARTAPLPGFERIAVAKLDSTGGWQIQLARRIKAAGIDLDMSRLG